MVAHTLKADYKTIILAGLGREGDSSWHYFSARFPQVTWIIADDRPLTELGYVWQERVEQQGVRYLPLADLASLGDDSSPVGKLDLYATLLVKTAGIPVEHLGIRSCLEKGATLTSNTAAFFEACASLPVPVSTIGVTGTKGKSTTTSLIYHCLKENGIPVVLAGNIGVPPLEVLNDPLLTGASTGTQQGQPSQPVVVLELSSHQLRELTISPHIAVIQDITPEHLDYYPSFAEYLAAKAAIARYQTPQDWLIYNPIYQAPSELATLSPAQKLLFSLEKSSSIVQSAVDSIRTHTNNSDAFVYEADGWLWAGQERVLETAAVPLVGQHNLLNTMPAIVIAMGIFGLSAADVARAIKTFTGLPHRLEYVGEANGVRYYNDSQATTPEAAIAALKSFPDKSIILLAGGSDKGISFDQLGSAILESNVSDLLLFPPMGEKISAAVQTAHQQHTNQAVQSQGVDQTTDQAENQVNNRAKDHTTESTSVVAGASTALPSFQAVESMSQAVQLAAQRATPGSVVLLSPACASFGLFKNYQDRGDQFKIAVRALGAP